MCFYYFFNVVMVKRFEFRYLNNIYFVLKDEIIEEVYLEYFIYNNCEINYRLVMKIWNQRDFNKMLNGMNEQMKIVVLYVYINKIKIIFIINCVYI